MKLNNSPRTQLLKLAAIAVALAPVSASAGGADAMTITGNDVGVGTATPSGSIHVRREGTATPSLVLETTGPNPDVRWEIKANATTGRLTFKDLNGTTTPFKFQPAAVENLFRVGIIANDTVDINGNLVITGQCTETDGACADYVFDPSYELPSLDYVADFIATNQHLPNVPSADEISKNGVNMAKFSGRLLAKIEELTLYTLQQQEEADAQQARIKDLEDTILELRQTNAGLGALIERVTELENAVQ